MLTVEQVIARLREAAEITPSVLPEGSEVTTKQGPLFEKILYRLRKIKESYSPSSRLTTFDYVRSYEIGDMSGNQLLRLLVGILNDDSLCKVGNGILLSINGTYFAAIVIFSVTQIELQTTPSVSPQSENRSIFSKLFDNNQAQSWKQQEYNNYHSQDQIHQLRKEAQIKFPHFLKENLSQTKLSLNHSFFCAFMAVLVAIAQTEIKRFAYCMGRASFNAIPVASCVKFVFESQQIENIGLLKTVFGEEKVFPEYIRGTCTKIKIACGMEYAELIVLGALPHNNRKFAEKDVQRAAEEIKDFYGL